MKNSPSEPGFNPDLCAKHPRYDADECPLWHETDPPRNRQILEAVCGECGETFIPNDEQDTIHVETQAGTECGGQGTITGHWGN